MHVKQAPVSSTLTGTIDAFEYGNVCLQIGAAGSEGSEDCLSLNIFTPGKYT